jgi:hypothetical protein
VLGHPTDVSETYVGSIEQVLEVLALGQVNKCFSTARRPEATGSDALASVRRTTAPLRRPT